MAVGLKLASVDRRDEEFVVTSYSQSPAGFWQMNGHFRCVPSDAEVEDLGRTVLEALKASNRIPVEADGRSPFVPVLRDLGLRNYSQYMKGATSVNAQSAQ